MAASIPWKELCRTDRTLKVLDPMAGSGTTIVVARALGHEALGFDTDPLAVLLARVWSDDVQGSASLTAAEQVVARAERSSRCILLKNAYPSGADEETRAFVRYWFDGPNRRQLASLARSISRVEVKAVRNVLWCAFSRLIITKQAGASLAIDVAHSRPHRTHEKRVIRPLEHFLRAVRVVVDAAPFKEAANSLPGAKVRLADARKLPLAASSVDVVVSSPPYLNAIDYLRGHKFSLIWMGYNIATLRGVRAANIGTEVSATDAGDPPAVSDGLRRMGRLDDLPWRQQRMLARYVGDMDRAVGELARVLVPRGRAVLVIGDCTMRGVEVRNSGALASLAEHHGLSIVGRRFRDLPPNRRYLPPPSSKDSGPMLRNRMGREVVLDLVKA
jgi:SAM-dependent methyltransferase